MNLKNIFSAIEKTDPEVYEKVNSRRGVLKNFSGFTGKAIIASLPIAIGSMFKKAYGQVPGAIVDVLNFALTLEYLESEFYQNGVAVGGLIPADDLPAFTIIRDHEVAHVNLLRGAIIGLGGTPVSYAFSDFDYSAGNGSQAGPYATVFSDYNIFLAVSQAFEDTGVRAYKGQAANLMSDDGLLTTALRIHSVEGRHAAHVRKLRRERGANQKPWITGNDAGGIPGAEAVYAGEELTVQGNNIQITNINGTGISQATATEAFDEPLTMAAVLAIVDPFII